MMDWSSDVCSSDLPPDRRAIATARRHGVDIGGLRARQLGRADFDDFDWLLCADHANLRDVQALGPDSGRARSTLFMEWAGLEGPIPDPYTGRSEEHTSELQSLMRISYAVFRLKNKSKAIVKIVQLNYT